MKDKVREYLERCNKANLIYPEVPVKMCGKGCRLPLVKNSFEYFAGSHSECPNK